MKNFTKVFLKQNKPKFLFVNPPYERLQGLNIQSISLGLLQIATVLHRNGYHAKVYDADTSFSDSLLEYSTKNRANTHENFISNLYHEKHEVWAELRQIIKDENPDIIGVSVLTPAYNSVLKVISIVKQMRPDCTILVGGPHITITGQEMMMRNNNIDFAFSGEAEESILSFAKAYEDQGHFHNIKGLIFRNAHSIINNGPSARIEDLDSLPIPDRKLMVFSGRYSNARLAGMISSRGCPYSCQFCASVPMWGRKVLCRSAQNLLEEIDYLVKDYSITSFYFWDDTFAMNKNLVREFCEGIVRKYGKHRFRWALLTHIKTLDENVLSMLRNAGCHQLKVGVESGSDRILESIEKGIRTEDVRKAFRLIRKKCFLIHTFFMAGFPYETQEDLRKTIDFIKEIKPDSSNLCTFTPYPGTKLYNYAVEHNLLKKDLDYKIYEKIGHHSKMGYFASLIPRETYLKLLNEILEITTYFSNKMTLRKLKVKIDSYRPARLKYFKMRDIREKLKRLKNKLLRSMKKQKPYEEVFSAGKFVNSL